MLFFSLFTNPMTAIIFDMVFLSLLRQLIFSSIKAFFSSKSSGGYPVIDNSGNTTTSAYFFFASSM
jgi:hypothetical protein